MRFPVRIFLIFGLALFVIALATLQPVQYFHGFEYDVRVINGFTNNMSVPLVIWCSSEDADLGGRALQEHDDFSWKMRIHLWGSNRMKCTIKWDQTRKSFVAFEASRDIYRCGPLRMCSWMAKEDGFYFSNDQVNWNKDFSWQ